MYQHTGDSVRTLFGLPQVCKYGDALLKERLNARLDARPAEG